jgi:hypothetical protein
VRGILELAPMQVVEHPPRIEISLVPAAGVADTVDFFMGAPRSFRLTNVPCGRYTLRVRSLGRQSWVPVNPRGIPEIHCQEGREDEIRVLLERRASP